MMMQNKSVFITGISGFVGSHMAKYLVDTGASVYGLVRRQADGHTPRPAHPWRILGVQHSENNSPLQISDLVDLPEEVYLEGREPDVIRHLLNRGNRLIMEYELSLISREAVDKNHRY